MTTPRTPSILLAIVLASVLTAMSSDAREAAAPTTPVPPGETAGESAAAPTLVAAALSESIPSPIGRARNTLLRPGASMPMVLARGVVEGGAAGSGMDRTYGSRATGSLRLGSARPLAAEARTEFLTVDRGEVIERRLVRSGARLLVGGPTRGAWVGAAFEQSLAGDRLPSTPLLGLGAWTAPGQVLLALSIEQTVERARFATVVRQEPLSDTLEAILTTWFDNRLLRATSGVVSGRWEQGRIGVETVAGVTVSRFTAPRHWMQTSLEVAVQPRLALFATLGNPAPRWLALDAGLSRKASLGLKLSSAVNSAAAVEAERRAQSPDFKLRHLGEGWYVVQVHAEASGSVEVMGDFSAWEPLSLRRVNGARWALALRLQPGVHQIQVRVDGGVWSPPAGLPTASDGFSGDVGVFVAR
jgi:hypothetical protein